MHLFKAVATTHGIDQFYVCPHGFKPFFHHFCILGKYHVVAGACAQQGGRAVYRCIGEGTGALPQLGAVPIAENIVVVEAQTVLVPFRGKTNRSDYIIKVAEKIAEIKGTTTEAVLKQCRDNAKKLFCI